MQTRLSVNLRIQTDFTTGSPAYVRRSDSPTSVTPVPCDRNLLSASFCSAAQSQLTPQPVVIEMPSPGSFNPLLEHFLRQPETREACQCLLARTSGKAFAMLIEEVSHRGPGRVGIGSRSNL